MCASAFFATEKIGDISNEARSFYAAQTALPILLGWRETGAGRNGVSRVAGAVSPRVAVGGAEGHEVRAAGAGVSSGIAEIPGAFRQGLAVAGLPVSNGLRLRARPWNRSRSPDGVGRILGRSVQVLCRRRLHLQGIRRHVPRDVGQTVLRRFPRIPPILTSALDFDDGQLVGERRGLAAEPGAAGDEDRPRRPCPVPGRLGRARGEGARREGAEDRRAPHPA